MSKDHESFVSEGQVIYDYNTKTGILKLNPHLFKESELEHITKTVKNNPKNVGFGISLMPVGTKVFYGVKEVRVLTHEEMQYEHQHKP